jgi:hypothetical protein
MRSWSVSVIARQTGGECKTIRTWLAAGERR